MTPRQVISIYRVLGFTLVEMVVVLVVTAILASVVAQLIQRPVESYQSQSRRVALVDVADTALRRMSRDVQDALPNSVRVGCGGQCVEFLRTVSGGRYRARPENNPFSLNFDPSANDSSFEVLGFLDNAASLQTGAGSADCRQNLASCVVIYNTGLTGTDAYNMDNAATLTSLATVPRILIGFDNTGFSSGDTAFPAASPEQRFYLVDTPVSYLCDLTQGTIRRYQGYNIRSSHGAVDTDAELVSQSNPAESALLINHLTACHFSYDPGSATRNSLLTMELTVADQAESITLLQQAHISNMP